MKTEEKNQEIDHGKAQAIAQLNSIKEMIEELREAEESDNNEAREEAWERIQEDPLSVQVRSGWYNPGGDGQTQGPEEFEILLCTGGPAVRIIGELDEYCQPESAKLQYQDWFTAWTDYCLIDEGDKEALLEYCNQFWFGD